MEILQYVIYAAIQGACTKYSVDPLLFIAIGMKEKGHYAWTHAVIGDLDQGGSISPMQLFLYGAGSPPVGWTRQAWANELTKPEVWTDVAAGHIAYLLFYYKGDLPSAIAAYNRGVNGTFDNYQGYVVPVLENYRQLHTYGITVVGSGDHDGQTFIPMSPFATANRDEWKGEFTEYAPIGGGNLEAMRNLKGIATDALEAGRRGRDSAKTAAELLNSSVAEWGKR